VIEEHSAWLRIITDPNPYGKVQRLKESRLNSSIWICCLRCTKLISTYVATRFVAEPILSSSSIRLTLYMSGMQLFVVVDITRQAYKFVNATLTTEFLLQMNDNFSMSISVLYL
jgi:hypothetical protein